MNYLWSGQNFATHKEIQLGGHKQQHDDLHDRFYEKKKKVLSGICFGSARPRLCVRVFTRFIEVKSQTRRIIKKPSLKHDSGSNNYLEKRRGKVNSNLKHHSQRFMSKPRAALEEALFETKATAGNL